MKKPSTLLRHGTKKAEKLGIAHGKHNVYTVDDNGKIGSVCALGAIALAKTKKPSELVRLNYTQLWNDIGLDKPQNEKAKQILEDYLQESAFDGMTAFVYDLNDEVGLSFEQIADALEKVGL